MTVYDANGNPRDPSVRLTPAPTVPSLQTEAPSDAFSEAPVPSAPLGFQNATIPDASDREEGLLMEGVIGENDTHAIGVDDADEGVTEGEIGAAGIGNKPDVDGIGNKPEADMTPGVDAAGEGVTEGAAGIGNKPDADDMSHGIGNPDME